MPRGDRIQLSLFPFMSVLACTIGSLTLLLVSLAVTSVGATHLRAAEHRSEESALAKSLPGLEATLERLERESAALVEAEARWAELDAALESRGLGSQRDLEATQRALAQRERGAVDRDELARVEARLAALEDVRDGVEVSIAVLESRRKTLPILIDPTGLSRRQQPYFMECDEGGLTAYRATDDLEYFIPLDDVGNHGDFNRYLRRVRATPGSLLVLLVRPGGIEAMERAERFAREAGVRVARMPLPGDGELDWRLLREAEGER